MKRRTFLAMVGAAVAALHLPGAAPKKLGPTAVNYGPTLHSFADSWPPPSRFLRYRLEWPAASANFSKSAFARISSEMISDAVPAFDGPTRFYVPERHHLLTHVENIDPKGVFPEESDDGVHWRPARDVEVVVV